MPTARFLNAGLLAVAANLMLAGCTGSGTMETASGASAKGEVTIEQSTFGTLPGGRPVTKWRLRNASGAGLTVMDLGATILTLEVPDRSGTREDVTFGFDTAAPYLTESPYFGAVVGRFANRIAQGRFTLDGTTYTLAANNGPNSLHGGIVGFDKQIWTGQEVRTPDGRGVRFTLVSPDGQEGYPGTVTVSTTYVWTNDDRLIVDYEATTDKATPFNVAQHAYWNLGGARDATSVLDHTLRIDADAYTPVNDTLIPTGEIRPVAGTPFDFRAAKPIGRDIGQSDTQLTYGKGFDHNWVLNGSGFRQAAVLADPKSGRRMAISTDQPGLQFYSGNFLDGKVVGKGGNAYPFRSAVALETQHFPDSPNQPGFPDAVLKPGQPFHSRTVFAFSVVR